MSTRRSSYAPQRDDAPELIERWEDSAQTSDSHVLRCQAEGQVLMALIPMMQSASHRRYLWLTHTQSISFSSHMHDESHTSQTRETEIASCN